MLHPPRIRVPLMKNRFGGGAAPPSPPAGYLSWLEGGTLDGEVVKDSISTLDSWKYAERPVLAFDGVDEYGWVPLASLSGYGTNIPSATSWDISFYFTMDSEAGQIIRLFNGVAGMASCLDFWIDDEANFGSTAFLYIGNNYFDFPGVSYLDGNTHFCEISAQAGSGKPVTVKMDGETVLSDYGDISMPAIQAIGLAMYDGMYYHMEGKLWDFKLETEAGLQCRYPLEEASGAAFYDVSGNGRHGIFSGTLGTARAARVDEVPSYNVLHGFRLASGVYIPALLSGASAADGNAITNPAGKVINGAPVKIVPTDPSFYRGDIVVSGTETELDGTWKWVGWYEGASEWGKEDVAGSFISKVGDSWQLGSVDTYTIFSDTPFPPTTGWSGDPAPTLTYSPFFADADGEFLAKSTSEIIANNADTDFVRSAEDGDGNLTDVLVYPKAPTGDDLVKLNEYLEAKLPYPMSYKLWQDSVLWLTAESTIIDAGTISAKWKDFARYSAGNAVQTTLDRQPARVFTNGVWALLGDGIDDFITVSLPVSDQWTYALNFLWPDEWPTNATGAIFGGFGGTDTSPHLGFRDDGSGLLFFRGGNSDYRGQGSHYAGTSLRGAYNWLIVRTDGPQNKIHWDTIYTDATSTPDPLYPITNSVSPGYFLRSHIGGVVTGYSTLPFRQIIACHGVWTDEEVDVFLGR
jgi:hypothetical protein